MIEDIKIKDWYTAVVRVQGCIVAREFVHYNSALEYLKLALEKRMPKEKAFGCIMNGKLTNIFYSTEVGPDESKH